MDINKWTFGGLRSVLKAKPNMIASIVLVAFRHFSMDQICQGIRSRCLKVSDNFPTIRASPTLWKQVTFLGNQEQVLEGHIRLPDQPCQTYIMEECDAVSESGGGRPHTNTCLPPLFLTPHGAINKMHTTLTPTEALRAHGRSSDHILEYAIDMGDNKCTVHDVYAENLN